MRPKLRSAHTREPTHLCAVYPHLHFFVHCSHTPGRVGAVEANLHNPRLTLTPRPASFSRRNASSTRSSSGWKRVYLPLAEAAAPAYAISLLALGNPLSDVCAGVSLGVDVLCAQCVEAGEPGAHEFELGI